MEKTSREGDSLFFVNKDLSRIDMEQLDLKIKIDPKFLISGQRPILPGDLKKWFRREGEYLVAEFHHKKIGTTANAKIKGIFDRNGRGILAISNNEYGSHVIMATIFPEEIISFEVK